jgi:hypothetical protein
VSGRRRKEELFDGALLLKPHEAVAEGGMAVETTGEAVGAGKAAAAAVRRRSVWPGRLCLDREAGRWAPRGFDFFSNLSKTGSTLKIQNGCLNLLQKFPIFACGSLGIL